MYVHSLKSILSHGLSEDVYKACLKILSQGFPTIMLFRRGVKVEDYPGGRSVLSKVKIKVG